MDSELIIIITTITVNHVRSRRSQDKWSVVPGPRNLRYNSVLYKYKTWQIVLSLELRKVEADLTMYFKIMNNFVDLNCDDFLSFLPMPNGFKLLMPSTSAKNVFNIRCIRMWNSLLSVVSDIVNCKSYRNFKFKLKSSDFSRFNLCFSTVT